MKIQYQDYGSVANIVITSTVFEFRKHSRVVDTTLFLVPAVVSSKHGTFILKTVISGKSRDALRAYRTAIREAAR
ncbi:TPA: hypothetical protein LTW91_003313 [Enterobacter hormaechei]|uniref:hypothetical protein n=1 Tax=Enterobacter hormaechei TaxID=158836 RepID=UPI000E307A33|nr:hypothetical protein [Enterobacter hormaechei]MDU3352153.1 hypothetical protein [Clostridium sp.]AXO51823.1 hypothetical protein AXA52_19540 [Enterobacter hormaechei]EKS6373378.1 hypothetical protein [Enterobacter hormaechei]EKS6476369.1 hypothetical protein [Enterobacter hormaechei]EKS6485678.1 hypothetical protein [Enterobacter hormaechei]